MEVGQIYQNRLVVAVNTTAQTKDPSTKTKADRTQSQNGLASVGDHAEQKKELKRTDRPGLARQAGKQACSLSELEDPPPRPSHLQVEEERTLLLSAWLFSGRSCILPPLPCQCLGNCVLLSLIGIYKCAVFITSHTC